MTNRSIFFSEHHHRLLIRLAEQVIDFFKDTPIGRNLDINWLINEGWFRQARYYEDLRGKADRIKREMFKWAFKEHEKVMPQLFEGADDVIIDKREFRLDQKVCKKWGKR